MSLNLQASVGSLKKYLNELLLAKMHKVDERQKKAKAEEEQIELFFALMQKDDERQKKEEEEEEEEGKQYRLKCASIGNI
jgi:hypothetical protein